MPSKPLRAMLAGCLVAASLLSGCTALSTERTHLIAKELDVDRDAQIDWLRVDLLGGEQAPADTAELEARLQGPWGTQPARLCWSPELAGGGCDQPVHDRSTWSAGEALFVPCPGAGELQVTLVFPDGGSVPHELSCGERA